MSFFIKYTREAGFLSYYEICGTPGWTNTWNNEQAVSYAVAGNQWVGYDDVAGLTQKVT